MNETELLKPLNGIRGIGAIIIAWFYHYNHFIVAQNNHPLYNSITAPLCIFGWMAVELFFFLSGITFMTIYSNQIREGTISGEEYAIKRFSRLWPVHVLALLIVAIVQMYRKNVGLEQFIFTSNDLSNFILNLFLMQNCGLETGASFNWVSWTLTVNVILYFIFFWICKKTKDEKGVLIASIIAVCIGGEMIRSEKGFLFFSCNIGRGFISFFVGVIAVILYRKARGNRFFDATVVLLIMICGLVFKTFGVDITGNIHRQAAITTITLFAFITVVCIRWKGLRIILNSFFFQKLGEISFSLFMIHYPVQIIIVTLNEHFQLGFEYSRLSFWVSYVCISLGAAILCYDCIELPASKYIRCVCLKK